MFVQDLKCAIMFVHIIDTVATSIWMTINIICNLIFGHLFILIFFLFMSSNSFYVCVWKSSYKYTVPWFKKKNVVEICLSQHSLCSGVLYSIEILIVDYTF